MRLTVSEKKQIIHLVETSPISVNRTLKQLGINKSTFYNWYSRYRELGEFYNKRKLFSYEDIDWNFRLKFIEWLTKKNIQLTHGNKTLKILCQFLESARRQKLHTNTDYHGKGWTVPRKKAKGQIVMFDKT